MNLLTVPNPFKPNSKIGYNDENVASVEYFDYQEDMPDASEVHAEDEDGEEYLITFNDADESHSVRKLN